MLLENPPPPITFLMVRPLNALKQKILFTSPLASFLLNLLLYQTTEKKKEPNKKQPATH